MRRGLSTCAAALLAGVSATPAAASVEPEAVRGPTRAQAWIASIVKPIPAYAEPRRSKIVSRLGPFARWAGGPNQLLVLGTVRDQYDRVWLRVRLPDRPNDASGWVRAQRVELSSTRWRVEIDVSDRRVKVLRAGRVVRRFSAVVGASGTATPRGNFAISEVVAQPDPSGFLGPWALHLTAHSKTLFDYGGGPGRVAIHGRSGESLLDPLGSARSHGCIRIDNDGVNFLARVLEPGVPVTIRS